MYYGGLLQQILGDRSMIGYPLSKLFKLQNKVVFPTPLQQHKLIVDLILTGNQIILFDFFLIY